MIVNVDLELCQSYGQCVFEAPELFDLTADGRLVYVSEVSGEQLERAEAAADACPVQAILFQEG